VPFEQLGFRTNVGTSPYPELTKEFLYGVPIVITLWPMFLLALNSAKNARQGADSGTIGKEAPQCP
jgi:hypothetical protein